jgi:L-alanine-DL-glutamate epimerase-like enolase superfamily enzyme
MLAEPIRPDGEGVLRVPGRPGIGAVLDEVAIRRFAA